MSDNSRLLNLLLSLTLLAPGCGLTPASRMQQNGTGSIKTANKRISPPAGSTGTQSGKTPEIPHGPPVSALQTAIDQEPDGGPQLLTHLIPGHEPVIYALEYSYSHMVAAEKKSRSQEGAATRTCIQNERLVHLISLPEGTDFDVQCLRAGLHRAPGLQNLPTAEKLKHLTGALLLSPDLAARALITAEGRYDLRITDPQTGGSIALKGASSTDSALHTVAIVRFSRLREGLETVNAYRASDVAQVLCTVPPALMTGPGRRRHVQETPDIWSVEEKRGGPESSGLLPGALESDLRRAAALLPPDAQGTMPSMLSAKIAYAKLTGRTGRKKSLRAALASEPDIGAPSR